MGIELSYNDKCEEILEWANNDAPWFDSTFIESMYDLTINCRKLSDRQKAAIDNVHNMHLNSKDRDDFKI